MNKQKDRIQKKRRLRSNLKNFVFKLKDSWYLDSRRRRGKRLPWKLYIKREDQLANSLKKNYYLPKVLGLTETIKESRVVKRGALDVFMFMHYVFSFFTRLSNIDFDYAQIKNRKSMWQVLYLFLKYYRQKPLFEKIKKIFGFVSLNILGKELKMEVFFLNNMHNVSRYIASNLGRVMVKGVKFRDFINPVRKDLDIRMSVRYLKTGKMKDLDKVNLQDSYVFLKYYFYKYFMLIIEKDLYKLKKEYLRKFFFLTSIGKKSNIDIGFTDKLNWFRIMQFYFFNYTLLVRANTPLFLESVTMLNFKLNMNLLFNIDFKEEKNIKFSEKKDKYAYFLNKLKHMEYWTQGSVLNGYKMHFKGRFSRKLRKSSVWFTNGSVGTSFISSNIDFGSYCFILKNSMCNLKVWLHKSDMQTHYKFRLW